MIDKLIQEILSGAYPKDTLPEFALAFTEEAEAQYFSLLRKNLQSDMAYMVFTHGLDTEENNFIKKGKTMNNITDIRQAVKRVSEVTLEMNTVSQAVYTIEECSELIKELTKRERGKGDNLMLIDEACDVLTSVFILLSQLDVLEEDVREKILFKCNRALDRAELTGEF